MAGNNIARRQILNERKSSFWHNEGAQRKISRIASSWWSARGNRLCRIEDEEKNVKLDNPPT